MPYKSKAQMSFKFNSCTLNADERRQEADKIMEMYGIGVLGDSFTESEKRFLRPSG